MNIERIAQKAGYKRITYYSHIKKKDLALSILNKYGAAINHDFSNDVPGMKALEFQEEDHSYAKTPDTLSEAIKDRDRWREKYYELLEKYQKLLEK